MKLAQMKLARSNGQMVSVLNLLLAVFVVFLIGLTAFELSRYFLARDELKTNVEVAALSCQTALVSSGDPTDPNNQAAAQAAGLQLFKQNSILGQPMTSATTAPTPGDLSPSPGQAQINFQFLDPISKTPLNASGAGVANGVTNPATAGTLIQAIGAYAYSPAFGQFIGLGNAQFTFQVSALSGVPKIDLLVLLDISGGEDNDTSISTYQRYQGPDGTNWMVNPNPLTGGSPAQGLAYTIMCGITDLGVLSPHTYDLIPGDAGCVKVHWTEDASSPGSSGLYGKGPGTPPGNAPCPHAYLAPDLTPESFPSLSKTYRQVVAMLNQPLAKALKGQHPSAREKHYLSTKVDHSLLKICTEIAGKEKANDNNINKAVKVSQLDDKFNTIAFAPKLYGLTSFSFPGSSGGASNPTAPSDYVSPVDGQGYFGASRQTGAGADTGPPVLPAVDGVCGSAPTVFGAPGNGRFTGIFVNGVIGATSSDGTMTFSSAATAIEAELGDLESPSNASGAGIDVSANGLNVTPQAGWYAFYYKTARLCIEPYMAIVYSLIGFINELAIVSDVHYGFIAFNDSVGTDANSVSAPIPHVGNGFNFPTFNPDGTLSVTSTYPLPNIPLSTTTSHQSDIIPILPTLTVWGNRNVTLALQTAYTQLQNNSRPGANKAIVLVVCGPPNGADTPAAAINQAATIGAAGIPVYVVCVAIQPNDDNVDDSAYTDIGGSAGGIAGATAHGAKYYRVDYSDPADTNGELVSVFGNIARRLVSTVQH